LGLSGATLTKGKIMDIERLNNELDRLNQILTKIPSMRLGMLLDRVIVSDPLVVGMFEFNCNSHDTGVSVKIDIVKDGERLNIINGTYWYSASPFGGNKFHWLHGAWDSALEKAIDEITAMATKNIEAKIKSHEEWIASIKKEMRKEICKFESFF
tara:strand:- start:480 stop:944 length:465 start_codon:yes stop_codon:yes gene_type:complete